MVLDTTVRDSTILAARSATRGGNLAQAEQLVRRYLDENGSTPEAMEALSWVARRALQAHRFSKASDYAKRVRRLVLRRLRGCDLDSGPHLATALGAAIEVLAQAMANRGRRAEAIKFLRRDLARFAATSIRFRLRKNLNLLTLEGQPAPQLENCEWLDRRPAPLRKLKGRPILLFFWAHYCEDSRAQGRVLARVRDRFAESGLILIGPTRRYGHLDEQGHKPARRREEMAHIEHVLDRYYRELAGMPICVSEHNFEIYGVSTTPTMALVDSRGFVSLYHPGKMSYGDLAAKIRKLSGTSSLPITSSYVQEELWRKDAFRA